jgi:sialate O-acetylesterase
MPGMFGEGFAIAGENRNCHWAEADIVGDAKIKLHNKSVAQTVAVRYAWADNPVCNVRDSAALPLTPFRTVGWPGLTDSAK